jgi:hypothetical protein
MSVQTHHLNQFGIRVKQSRLNSDGDLTKRRLPLERNPSPSRDCVAIPFMVREPHHERGCLIANSGTYPFALSESKGSERIATQSPTGGVRVKLLVLIAAR